MTSTSARLTSRRAIGAVALALLVAVLQPAAARGADSFFSGIDDLPLMPGLSESAGESTSFDTPSGRIQARAATGAVSRAAVLRFYGETLPQLGWRPVGDGVFTRNGEKLKIEFPRRPAGARGIGVRILITPG